MQKQRRCDNCTFSIFARGSGRPTLICRQEKGHEGIWQTRRLLEKCDNFHPSRAAKAHSSAPRLIPLTRGKFAVVDAQDYPEISKFIWCADEGRRTYYATRRQNGKIIKMHRQLIKAPEGLVVDHIDHDGCNNRRSNLRLATLTENSQNKRGWAKTTSRYKGVYWRKNRKKWAAAIVANKERHHLGCFKNEVEAAKAYDEAAKKLHREFAALNFTNDTPD